MDKARMKHLQWKITTRYKLVIIGLVANDSTSETANQM